MGPCLLKMTKVLLTGWWLICGLNQLKRFFGGGESGLNWKQAGGFEDFSVGNTVPVTFLKKKTTHFGNRRR